MTLPTALEILGVIIPLFHVVGIAFATHAILTARTSQGAIAWAFSLVFVPYVSLPLYLVFGRQKFVGYVEARRSGDRRIDHLAARIAKQLQPDRANLPGDCQRFKVLEKLTLTPFTTGNAGRLLVDGDATFEAIFAAIDAATSYILVQFFIIRDDALGKELQQRLIRKVAQGVKAYLLYDEVGCISTPRSYFNGLCAGGVDVHPFNTRRGWKNRFQINFRNHRKIVLVDGKVAYIGGLNVGDEYMGQSKRFGHWRDTQIELRGPCVAAVELSFLQDWHWATGEMLGLPVMPPPTERQGEATAIIVPSSPADAIRTCTLMLLSVISMAKQRLWIASPYFVPDETVYDALQLAALRGVDVRIMLPTMPDHWSVYLAAFSYLESAEAVGVKFYRYQAGFLHQKVMLVDDDLASVGSVNFDNRSMLLNFELTAFFADAAFAKQTADMLEKDFAQCERATPGDLHKRGLFFRFAVRIARLFSPIE
jgi:cardiolipin synthase A/B